MIWGPPEAAPGSLARHTQQRNTANRPSHIRYQSSYNPRKITCCELHFQYDLKLDARSTGRHVIANGRRGHGDEVLNLCFHGIGTPERALEPDEDLYWVRPEQFDEFLKVIGRYPSVRITFDDGNASDVRVCTSSAA